ncbi:hypothetical protein HHK36_017234 [Tetracentron sinense]|uniref:Uncharacterized protein n=1 Tax=Tetracentron sinense TaxID=13715 RepID=A0A834Z236_TETSI|nr:hypothetical protein HHK36_017234 [Tetracentron sinense]
MEFVGRTVKKELQGFGILSGVINSYDPSSGFFEIVFEDGDSEELDFDEVVLLLEGMVEPATSELIEKQSCGRRPKKRRREDPKWEIRDDSGKSTDSFVKDICSEEGSEETQMEDKVIHGGSSDTLDNECWIGRNLEETVLVNGNSNENVSSVGLNLNVTFEENLKKNDYFDVNLKENGAFDGNLERGDSLGSAEKTQKREGCVDLNLCFHDETEITNSNTGGDLEKNTSPQMLEETRMEELGDGGYGKKIDLFGPVEEAQMKGSISNGSLEEDIYSGVLEETPVKGTSGLGEHVMGDSCLGFVEGIQEEGMDFSRDSKGNDYGVFDLNEGTSDAGVVENQGNGSDLGTPEKDENSRKKRKRISEDLKSTRGTMLRRSTRRMTTSSSQIDISSMEKTQAVNDISSSPSVNADSDGKPIGSGCEESEEQSNLPGKLELPPSSENLKLDEIPILDLFSVYACLRSFSTLLFLSPFDLEAFVEALKCKLANSLIDFIHLSILQTLKIHLEFLSNEGSQSASGCLRSLNWDLLDLITWPLFMVEYLLLCGSRLKPGFDLSRLKLMSGDYYKQPAAVKLELLRCLCDDVIEAEAIRSELNKRTLASERIMDVDRTANTEICKKRKDLMDDLGGSCLTQETVDDTIDWNSDECCLCKMDGSLICCDGCPAAYHSRCVGVAKDLLPEGEWYCPECVIEKHEPWMKSRKSLRGAELLGIDPQGRLYFGSCGYLLVLDSCDTESLYYYYHRNDLNAVMQMLKSADILYSGIITAISMHWDIPVDSTGGKGPVDSHNRIISADLVMDSQISSISTFSLPVPYSETNEVKDEAFNEREPRENCVIAEDFGHPSYKVSQSANRLENVNANQLVEMPRPFASSEGPAEISQAATGIQSSQKTEADCLNKSVGTSKDSEITEKIQCSVGDCSLRSHECEVRNVECAIPGHTPSLKNPRKGDASQMQFETGYINYYSFAHISASVAEELMCKSLDNINADSNRSAEEIISLQLKAISKKSTKFCWPNVQKLNMDAQKENCGWCFSCKTPTDSGDCVFNTNNKNPAPESSKSEVVSLRSKSRKSHLIAVMCHILSLEDRLCGLLLGPWQDPHHTKLWRKSYLKAFNVAIVKHLLLALESNLRRVSLSAEWLKQVDSVVTMGSASHVMTNASSKHGIGKKRARFSEPESNSSSNAATRTGILWWRGGRLSRQVFHWKVLPRTLASKSARQAGCTKIPGILYPDGSEFAKRSKYVAWRASVETSTNLAQLAFQVRELDSNIRWDDLENTHLSSQLSKESRKLMRPFKKVTIRRKCIEGTSVKYLLDFGKRKTIPDIVIKHGFMLEASSSERKKYWLDESHVPLYLLKAFEEKKLARKSNTKTNSRKHPELGGRVMKKPSKKSWLSYLLSKVEKSENYQCGHCNKDVLVREAAKCQYCKDWFHGDALGLTVENIVNLLGFRCHMCLKSNPPVCPHWQDVTNDGVRLCESKNNAGDECVVDVSDVDQLPSVSCEKQRFSPHEDSPGSFRLHGSINKEQKVGTPPDSCQAHILECVTESEKGHISINEEQKEDAILVSIDEEQKPDALTDSCRTLMLEESITDSEKGNTIYVESLVEARHPSCKSDEDVVETGVELLGPKAGEGMTVITAIPEFVVAGTLGDSSELHRVTTLPPT